MYFKNQPPFLADNDRAIIIGPENGHEIKPSYILTFKTFA